MLKSVLVKLKHEIKVIHRITSRLLPQQNEVTKDRGTSIHTVSSRFGLYRLQPVHKSQKTIHGKKFGTEAYWQIAV